MSKLETIKTFFDNYKFDKNVLVLDQCTKILNVEKYVKTNIKLLESNSGNKLFLPYFLRLEKVYKKTIQDDTN